MALSSFIAWNFNLQTASSTYELVKWSPYVFLKFFMKILNLLTILDKNILFMFFFIWNFKILKLLVFLSHRDYEQNAYFWKTPVDRCQHRSAVKNMPPPSPSFPVPIPPPTVPTTPAPTAQGQWYRAFWIMWPPRPMAVAPLAHSIGNPFRSLPPPPPPA